MRVNKSSLLYKPRHHRIQVPKSLAQKRFKSNLEFRYQIIVLSIMSSYICASFNTRSDLRNSVNLEVNGSKVCSIYPALDCFTCSDTASSFI